MKNLLINLIRSITPLYLRKKIGPILAYFSYLQRISFWNKNKFAVLSIEKTIEIIKDKKLSIIRFGDGEMSLIDNKSLGFQDYDKHLSEKLVNILLSDHDDLLICVPGIFGKLNDFIDRSFWFSLHHVFRYGYIWRRYIKKDKIYGDAFITRPYLTFKNKENAGLVFANIFSIWDRKNVVLIEGDKSRLGVGNDMFSKTSSLQRILCPAENAYSKYEEIKMAAMNVPKDKLILISLGPTAKVLAYDLFLLGYRVIDIGHIDMEYEMFLRNENGIVKIDYKYFNEINERNPGDCLDQKYLSQIICKI